jgi:hypothetical protein
MLARGLNVNWYNTMKICLAPFRILWTPYLGGQSWVYLNWALGFQANGCDVTILETVEEDETPEGVLGILRGFKESLRLIGVEFEIALAFSQNQIARYECIHEELKELTTPLEATLEQAEMLINFRYGLDQKIVNRFKRSALIDIDPALLQLWVSEGQFDLIPHDLYFSIGETVGQPEALFPDLGLQWHYTPPVVFLPAWEPVEAASSAPYTTVSNWWSSWESYNGEAFNNEKRTSFLEYVDLPSRVPVSLELALCINMDPEVQSQDRQLLESKGWRLQGALDVTSTLGDYRSYIQSSRGEFSCAKPSCMRFQNAWISDRTLCYMASGKPAVVQHTGSSRFLPDAEGLVRFRDFDEAIRGLTMVEEDYDYHSRRARAFVEAYFDARKVTQRVLDRILALKAKHT